MARPKVNINVSGGAGVRNKHRGTSEERPVEGMLIGFEYFDTDLGYPIWWSGDTSDDKSGWVNALGEDIFRNNPDIKILAFGDSIINAVRNGHKSFLHYVTNAYLEMADSGDTLSTISSSIVEQIDEYNESFIPDIVLTDGGYNDWNRDATLGAMPTSPVSNDTEDSALDKSTVYGAVQHIFYQMIKKFPDAHRMYVSTHRINLAPESLNSASTPYTLTQLMEGIREICGLYGVIYVDVFDESFLVTKFSQYKAPGEYNQQTAATKKIWDVTYYVNNDGIHPLDLGYRTGYAPIVYDAILKCMNK